MISCVAATLMATLLVVAMGHETGEDHTHAHHEDELVKMTECLIKKEEFCAAAKKGTGKDDSTAAIKAIEEEKKVEDDVDLICFFLQDAGLTKAEIKAVLAQIDECVEAELRKE